MAKVKKKNSGKKKPFDEWFKTLPEDKRGMSTYNLRRAYELAPAEDLERFAKDPDFHLNTFYFNEKGVGEFMKSPEHKTVDKELDFYYSDLGKDFRSKYDLVQTPKGYEYRPKDSEQPLQRKKVKKIEQKLPFSKLKLMM